MRVHHSSTRGFENILAPVISSIFKEMVSAVEHEPKKEDLKTVNEIQYSKPLANIKAFEDKFEIHLAVPGLTKDDIDIQLEQSKLTISASKEEIVEGYKRREFRFGTFARSFNLPENIDANNIQAKMDNGILMVTVAKLPKQEALKIIVQ